MQTGSATNPHGLDCLRMADNTIVECNLAQEKPTSAGAFEPGLYQPPARSQARRRLVHRLLARYGAYEVRLVELAHGHDDDSSLWLRLYDRDSRASLDDRRCDDLEHAEILVEHLLSRAMQLHHV